MATISINAVFGENGLIQQSQRAKELQEQKQREEQEGLNTLDQYVGNYLNGNGKVLVSSITSTEHETMIAEDDKGNQVVIPGGFKIASDSGTTVQKGIVIEDNEQNQFVWIPVSNINHDGSNKIKLDDNSEIEITLGRYTFDSMTGVETKVQYGSEYKATPIEEVTAGNVDSYAAISSKERKYYELTAFRELEQGDNSPEINTTAKDLAGFVDSVSKNKGYYFARYEASYASGNTFGVGDNSSYYKPASKVSITHNNKDSMDYTPGNLWTWITQGEASKASRQMYYGNSYIDSDLCNSYAWDTAIIYIQAMGNKNYANMDKDLTGNTILKNTGETGDVKCNIFDMAANCVEWTTEYSTYENESGIKTPCGKRGGHYSAVEVDRTQDRYGNTIIQKHEYDSFRAILYLK